jgi:DNA-binding MarR family transcriptional regulator
MKNKLFVRQVQALVSIAAKMIRDTMDDRLEQHQAGITTLQYGILRIIEHGAETISVISKKQMLDPSTLVPAVDALERNGFVRRTKDPKDRRRTPIQITTKGQELLARIPMLDESDSLVRALAQISDAHQRELVERLQELVSKLTSDDEVEALIATLQAEIEGE